MEVPIVFPQAEFVRRGPPAGGRNPERAQREKWARVMVVLPKWRDTGERPHYEFILRGPYTLPMALRRTGVSAGSKDAWTFFTHPYEVFPRESTYYNVAGKGCLDARLYVRGEKGVRLYDEVGAGFEDAEMVAEGFHGALGVLRNRVIGNARTEINSPYATALVEFDLDLLEVLRLCTLMLQTQSPREVICELGTLVRKPTVRSFLKDVFDDQDHAALQAIATATGELDERRVNRFRVREEDFTQVVSLRDTEENYPIQDLLDEYEAFKDEHGERLQKLSEEFEQAEANLEEIKKRVRGLQNKGPAGAQSKGKSTRTFKRLFGGVSTQEQLNKLKAEAVHNVRRIRDLEAEYQEIPGYSRLQGLTGRVKDCQDSVNGIYRLARDLFDHNVTQGQLRALRMIHQDRICSDDPRVVVSGYKNYDLRLRAEILAKVLTIYSLSAFVLRRPDALPESFSRHNIHRINRLSRKMIEYFRYVRYGSKTMGDAFDEAWGQVLKIEGQL